MEADRKRWNEKYQEGGGGQLAAADPFLCACLEDELVQPGRALELAAGSGRNSIELARRGWQVAAWDVSDVALERIDAIAAAAPVDVETRRVNLDPAVAAGAFPTDQRDRYDLIVIINFLDRGLLPRIAELLSVGGVVCFATFTTDRTGEKPSSRWCLNPGELQNGFEGYRTLRYDEQGGRAGWLGRLED